MITNIKTKSVAAEWGVGPLKRQKCAENAWNMLINSVTEWITTR